MNDGPSRWALGSVSMPETAERSHTDDIRTSSCCKSLTKSKPSTSDSSFSWGLKSIPAYMAQAYLILAPPPYLVLDHLVRPADDASSHRHEEDVLVDEERRQHLDRDRRRREDDVLVDEERHFRLHQRDDGACSVRGEPPCNVPVKPGGQHPAAIVVPTLKLILRLVKIWPVKRDHQ